MDEKEKEVLTELRKAMEAHERGKTKRSIYTILFYSAAWYWVLSSKDQIVYTDISAVVGCLTASIIFGTITVLVSSVIFYQLFSMSNAEKARIEYLEKEFRKLGLPKIITEE